MLVAVGVPTTAADAAGYGEITHFGLPGTAAGELDATEEASAFGVDPTDNSVYVVDLPDETEHFRLQKFSANAAGEYRSVASVQFKPADAEGLESPDTVEGVAVDPAMKRVYVLAAELRPASVVGSAPEELAASELYAFSTEQSGEALLPALGTPQSGARAGVLAPPHIFKPLATKVGVPLLEPSGIAVDPVNHDIIVLGERETASTEPLVAALRLSDEGTVQARYTDTSNYFEGEGATSPSVSATGQILVDGFDEIVELPANLASGMPTPFIQFDSEAESLTEFPGEPLSLSGGALAIGPEGTIDTKAAIVQERAGSLGGLSSPGVIAFTPGGVEEGWTGGQSKASNGVGGPCQISSQGVPSIAAGKNHDIFVYNNDPAAPQITEFGPGGGGCPTATATVPTASVNGTTVPESEPIPQAESVTLTSQIVQGNALSVEWEFGDGTAETVSARQYETSEVTHHFAETGELELTEKIHTDDLATPQIDLHRRIDIVGLAPSNTALPTITGLPEQGVTMTAQNGSWSEAPSAYSYQWMRCTLDGAECASILGATAPEYTPVQADIAHELAVEVTATNSHGSSSASSATTNVVVADGPPPANTAPPTITGPAEQSVTLTAHSGSWANEAAAYSYHWMRCTSGGTECASISGATAPEYTPVEADIAHELAVEVTATNSHGSSSASSTTTSAVLAAGHIIAEYAVRTSSDPFGIAAGPDGNVWFTEHRLGYVGKVTPGGTVTEYPGEGWEGKGITAGPDGNLWFVEEENANVGRMTPTGTLKRYHSPEYEYEGVDGGTGIVAGPDGNLWFTESNLNYIGKMNVEGEVLAVYRVPYGSDPHGVAVGAHEELWFTEYGTSKIARSTITGAITEYSLPKSSGPDGITAGPEGDLWFTNEDTNKIGKIATSGEVTEYALPAHSKPRGIAVGPDENLWFTDWGTGKIGRITTGTTGTVTEFALPKGSDPNDIVAGANGALWYTDEGTSKIGEIAP